MIKKLFKKLEMYLHKRRCNKIFARYQIELISKAVEKHGQGITPCVKQSLNFLDPGHYMLEPIRKKQMLSFHYNDRQFTHAQMIEITNFEHFMIIQQKLKEGEKK